MTATTTKHPARYSRETLDVFRSILADAPWIHDPFAGTGERLGAIADELGVPFTGTEIEAPYIVRGDCVMQGDSRDAGTYPPHWETSYRGSSGVAHWWIVTSPVYPNGMADHFLPSGVCSKCKGGSGPSVDSVGERMWLDCDACQGTGQRAHSYKTYRAAAIALSGDPTYALDEGNMGRHSYRSGRRAEERYWAIAEAVVPCWGGAERAVVNVKDFTMSEKGAVRYVDLAGRWTTLLVRHGWELTERIQVPCPGMKHGANRDVRVAHEDVLVFVR